MQLRKKKINVISVNNGVGLTTDYQILRDTVKGVDFSFIDIYDKKVAKPADANIWLEVLDSTLFRLAPKNVLIPNPEWFYPHWNKHLKSLTAIWAKTRDTERIFKKLHKNVQFCSFTSPDRMDRGFTGNKRKVFLHIAGKSETKGTAEVVKAFSELPHKLFIVSQTVKVNSAAKNIIVKSERLTDDEIRALQAGCLFHVCTSQYEGFGHYLHEGMSNGIVITTDAPPMNEWIQDRELLVEVSAYGRQRLGRMAHIDVDYLRLKADKLMQMTDDQIRDKYWYCRNIYLENKNYFTKKINELIHAL